MNLTLAHKKVNRKHVPRTIVVARPNVMWETDITKVYIDHECWIYFTAYVDLCSRKIKGYLVSRMSRTREVIEAFDNAILNTFPDLNASGLIIPSDNYEKHLKTTAISSPSTTR
jgi:putative transposase